MKKTKIIKVKLQEDYKLVTPRNKEITGKRRRKLLDDIRSTAERVLGDFIDDMYPKNWDNFDIGRKEDIVTEIVYDVAYRKGLYNVTDEEVDKIVLQMDIP